MSEVLPKDIESYEDFLPIQYSESAELKTFLNVYLEQVQQLEDANIDLDTFSTDIDVAFGTQLDIIGKLVGADRGGRTDVDYRSFIRFRIAVNSGSGTPDDVFNYLLFITGADKVKIFPHYPASVYIFLEGTITPDPVIPATVDEVLAAGVSLGYIGYSDNPLVFTPYDTEFTVTNMLVDNGENLELDTEEGLLLQAETPTIKIQNGYLAESTTIAISELVDDEEDNIIDNVSDLIVVNDFITAPDLGFGKLAETL